jgi:hypothetical protein
MEGSFWHRLTSGLLGVAALGGLALALGLPGIPSPRTAAPAGHPERGWRLLNAVTYENISIFPVVSGATQDTSAFLTLDEGLASGEVIVREQGAEGMIRDRDGWSPRPIPQYQGVASVNQLVLINRSKRPLLLLAGELVSGGKQDRIIGKDRVVPIAAPPLPLDVFCVEHGRWTGVSSKFMASKTIVHPSVREQAAVNGSQSNVWDAVVAGSTYGTAQTPASGGAAPALSRGSLAQTIVAEAPTQSYTKIYEGRRVGVSVENFAEEVERRFAKATSGLKGEHVVGVVVAYGGEVAWSDIFASGDLFEHYWSKLLRSYAVEALARPTLRETAAADDAREFLHELNGREVVESEPGVYRWREVREGKLALIELEALQPKTITLHRLLLHRTS